MRTFDIIYKDREDTEETRREGKAARMGRKRCKNNHPMKRGAKK
jgi:hypothetical protein